VYFLKRSFPPIKVTHRPVFSILRYDEAEQKKLTYVEKQLGDAIVGESEQLHRPLRNPRLKEGMILRYQHRETVKADIKRG
jgi:hypothetical protein